jgi:bifunctional UDP-N-acetylglucosamine pyrophosphorylase/glucosamine-1-phosphate N-acetyltransferase
MRSNRAKVLQPLAGRTLLAHVLDCAATLHPDEICVVYGFAGDQVMAAFQDRKIRWAKQIKQLGTGHAVIQAVPEIPDGHRILVLFGDVPLLQPGTLKRLVDTCQGDDLGVLTVDMENPHGYGRIVREKGRVVRNVEEKDATDDERLITEINTGVLCCTAARLKDWLDRLSDDNSQGEYYLTDVIALAVEDGVTVHGVKADDKDEVMGINDKQQLAQAERALQLKRVQALMAQGVGFADPSRVDIRGTLVCGKDVFIDVNAVFEGDVVLGDEVVIESNNLIRQSQLGPRTLVHSNCHLEGAKTGTACEIGPFSRMRPGTELADNVKIGNFVEIKNSDIDFGSKVNHLSYVGDTEIGKHANLGAGTITCNYDGANKYKTTIGDGAFIGSGVELVAPVNVGENATIGAGSTISKDAPADKLTLERARQVTVPNWKKPEKNKKK